MRLKKRIAISWKIGFLSNELLQTLITVPLLREVPNTTNKEEKTTTYLIDIYTIQTVLVYMYDSKSGCIHAIWNQQNIHTQLYYEWLQLIVKVGIIRSVVTINTQCWNHKISSYCTSNTQCQHHTTSGYH